MSISLVENPVVTEDGIVENLFAGFEPVEFKFKREDLTITSVGQGIDNNVLVTITTDLSTYLNVGDTVYVYSEGDNFTYDDAGAVIAVTSTTVTVGIDFIEAGSGGYINYKRNYYIEVEVVNEDNQDVKVLPFSLIDDGDNAGNITIDVSIVNDLNIQCFEFLTRELTDSRTVFMVQYREVYDDDTTQSYILINNVLVLAYATQQPEVESLINDLDLPVIYKGYPNGIILAHTETNADNTGIIFTYDELDINQNDLVTGTDLGLIEASKEGFIFIDINKDISYNSLTEYVKINAGYTEVTFFSPEFFDDNFFEA